MMLLLHLITSRRRHSSDRKPIIAIYHFFYPFKDEERAQKAPDEEGAVSANMHRVYERIEPRPGRIKPRISSPAKNYVAEFTAAVSRMGVRKGERERVAMASLR